MAKFKYKMQNILDIKLRLETQAKTEFAIAASKLSEEEDKLKQLLVRRMQYESQARQLASDKIDVIEIKKNHDAMEAMKTLLQRQAVQVRIAEKGLDNARKKLNTAMQDRKIHDKLKERAFDEFKLELNAEEKKEIDELVSFNYNDNSKEMGD